MSRSIWKGAISFGLVHIPVEVMPAGTHKDLDLKMIDRRDFAPIGYRRINKESGEEVEWDDIVKAYEYQDHQYVVLSDEDLRRANVKATQTIDILHFIEAGEIDSTYFAQPYYLKPGKGGEKVYALLLETLRSSRKIGIAQVVMHSRQHLVALIAHDNLIVLNTLRYPDELRPASDLDLPELSHVGITDKEINMALALVDDMTAHWNPAHYVDTYRDDVLALVRQKVRARQTHVITGANAEASAEASAEESLRRAEISDLLALLKDSLHASARQGATKTRTAARRPHDLH